MTWSIVLALASTWPVLLRMDYWGRGDWDQHIFFQAVPRHTILTYRQWPLWNPWYCGGMVMLANPQSRFLAPTFPLVLWAGPVTGIKLEIPVYFALSLAGGIALGRALGLSHLAALTGAAVYSLSTMVAVGLVQGMTWLLACAYVPWALAFFHRGLHAEHWASAMRAGIACAATLTLMFLNGGAYPLAWTGLNMGLYALCDGLARLSRRPRDRLTALKRPVGMLSMSLSLTLCLGAVKFLPSMAYMHRHPRRLPDFSGYGLGPLAASMVTCSEGQNPATDEPTDFLTGLTWNPSENAAYVGWAAAMLAAIGLATHGKRYWHLAVLLALMLWAALGHLAPVSLWAALRCLPVFDSMRVAQRARLLGWLWLAMFAGCGVQAVARRGGLGRAAAVALVAAALGDLVCENGRLLARAFRVPPAEVRHRVPFRQISKLEDVDASQYVDNLEPLAQGTLSMLYPAFLCNLGTVHALESASTSRRAHPSDSSLYCGEAFLWPERCRAHIAEWSPNRVTVEVEAEGPSQLVLNQNYDAGWRVHGGASPGKWISGFIGCDVPLGRSLVTFTYRPVSAVAGAWLSLAAAVALASAWIWLGRRREGTP